jgi:hypothetical protein
MGVYGSTPYTPSPYGGDVPHLKTANASPHILLKNFPEILKYFLKNIFKKIPEKFSKKKIDYLSCNNFCIW